MSSTAPLCSREEEEVDDEEDEDEADDEDDEEEEEDANFAAALPARFRPDMLSEMID